MSSFKFYHNPQCSKSREALTLLESEAVDFQIIDYVKDPLSIEELQILMERLNGPISFLVRMKESEFTDAPFDVNSPEEVALHLSKKPRLMERPVLQGKYHAVIGRPLENIKALLNSSSESYK